MTKTKKELCKLALEKRSATDAIAEREAIRMHFNYILMEFRLLLTILAMMIERMETPTRLVAREKTIFTNRAYLESEAMLHILALGIIVDEILIKQERSAKAPKTLMEKDFRSTEIMQTEWKEKNKHEWAINCRGLSMMDRKQLFADDRWIFAGNSSDQMDNLVHDDAFCSQELETLVPIWGSLGSNKMRVRDITYSKAIQRSLERIYPERNPDISPGDHLREKFNKPADLPEYVVDQRRLEQDFDAGPASDMSIDEKISLGYAKKRDIGSEKQCSLDRIIFEDCKEIQWGKSKAIRHVQLAGPGYETEPSQTRLEMIASFCQCTLKEAKQLKDAYRLLELDFNTVRAFNKQIRERPSDRSPMDVRLSDWFEGKTYALGVGKFKNKESRTKYKAFTKQKMWEEYKSHFPETTAEQFNTEFPDGHTTLNQLMENFLLPTLVENKVASLVEDGCKMNMVSYEMFIAEGASKNWNVNAVNADETAYEDMDYNDLVDSFHDQEEYANTDHAFQFDQEYTELSAEDLRDEFASDSLIDVRLAEIEEMAIRPNNNIDVLPYTFWSSDMIKEDETLKGTKRQRALYEKSLKQLSKCKSIASLRQLKRDMGFNLSWPQFKKIEALMYKKVDFIRIDEKKTA